METKTGLVLCAGLVLTILPLPGLVPKTAGDPFSSNGTIAYIEPTIIGENVFQLPDGTWLVDDREIAGTFDTGDIIGPYSVKYDAIVQSAETQVGTFTGTISARDDENDEPRFFEVTGSLEPVVIVMEGPYAGLPRLSFSGEWLLVKNKKQYGEGTFEAWLIFVPEWIDGVPHVGIIVESSFTLTGTWDNQGNDDRQ